MPRKPVPDKPAKVFDEKKFYADQAAIRQKAIDERNVGLEKVGWKIDPNERLCRLGLDTWETYELHLLVIKWCGIIRLSEEDRTRLLYLQERHIRARNSATFSENDNIF